MLQEFWREGGNNQLSDYNLLRDLNKAYCGFTGNGMQQCKPPTAVATGNWGCGAFGGNPYIKALIQLMAASQAGRPMYYFTFDDWDLGYSLHEVLRVYLATYTDYVRHTYCYCRPKCETRVGVV